MTKCWDILGLGVITVDDLIYVEEYPGPETKLEINTEIRQGGGLTATALVAASRMGAKVAYCAILGENELSHFARQELENEGVDCTQIFIRAKARPIHSTIIVDLRNGHRTILYSTEGVTYPLPEDITDDLINSCRVLFVDNYPAETAIHSIKIAKKYKIPVVADIEENHPNSLTLELLKQADHLIIGKELGMRITGQNKPAAIVKELIHDKHACCIVTAGDQGCWYSEQGGDIIHFPAYRIQAVDTTGCGDVFHGVYAASIAKRNSVSMAIQMATAAASLKATKPGGRSGIPTRSEIDMFLKRVIQ